MPNDEHIEVYDELAADYAAKNATGPFNALYERPAMLSLLGDVSGKRVLDAGCGSGVLAAELLRRGARVTGFDASGPMVAIARERLGPTADLFVADLNEPLDELATASFDVVVASLAMHYVEDWQRPLSEFSRVLVADGVVAISTHHPTMDWPIAGGSYFETRKYTDTWTVGGKEIAIAYWRRPLTAMTDAFAAAGFTIESLTEPAPLPECEALFPDAYTKLVTAPRFIFFRLRKR